MLRELINHGGKAAEATYVAATELKTGMGVVKNADGTCSLPEAATSKNIFLVDKEHIPTGVNAGRTYLSDYEDEFNTVAQGDRVKLPEYDFGEKFATSEYTGLTDSDIGKAVEVGTDGKWVVASAASIYRFEGIYMDAGTHELAKIAVMKDAITN